MSPPDLPADAPVANVLQPLHVNFFPMRGKEANEMIVHYGERFFRLRITQEPLLADAGLDWHIAPIAEADVVFIRHLFQK